MAPLFPLPRVTRFDLERWSHIGRRWERTQTAITTAQAARIAAAYQRIGLRQGTDYRFTAF